MIKNKNCYSHSSLMRDPDTILVRVSGEISLKSEQVKGKFMEILKRNIKKGLNKAEIKHKIEENPSRIFVKVDKENMEKAVNIIKNIFGVHSVSPSWSVPTELREISIIASDIAKEVLKLDETKSFALRVRLAGRHRKFSLKSLAEEVGASVKRVTNAQVNLDNPDHEIFIEARSRRTYVFLEKIKGVGGLPIGTGGRITAMLFDLYDLVSAWLVMKRGNELNIVTNSYYLEDIIKKWHIGGRIKVEYVNSPEEFFKLEKFLKYPICYGSIDKAFKNENYVFINPLIGLEESEIEKMCEKIQSVRSL